MVDIDTLELIQGLHDVVELQQATIIDLTAALVGLSLRVDAITKGE